MLNNTAVQKTTDNATQFKGTYSVEVDKEGQYDQLSSLADLFFIYYCLGTLYMGDGAFGVYSSAEDVNVANRDYYLEKVEFKSYVLHNFLSQFSSTPFFNFEHFLTCQDTCCSLL